MIDSLHRVLELELQVRELKQAIETREEFLAIAAHELKTPITATKLKFQTALRLLDERNAGRVPPEKLAQLFRDGDRQMSRLGRLIDNLLDLSRLQTGKLNLQFERADMSELLQDVLERFSEQLNFSKCTLTSDCTGSIIGVWDRDRLDQVFSNLVTNALRYAPGTRIFVGAQRDLDTVTVTISDQGPGIPSELHAKIFDRYERGNSPSPSRGLGLGLYISREIIRAHQGTIELSSQPQQGATFKVVLPLVSHGYP